MNKNVTVPYFHLQCLAFLSSYSILIIYIIPGVIEWRPADKKKSKNR